MSVCVCLGQLCAGGWSIPRAVACVQPVWSPRLALVLSKLFRCSLPRAPRCQCPGLLRAACPTSPPHGMFHAGPWTGFQSPVLSPARRSLGSPPSCWARESGSLETVWSWGADRASRGMVRSGALGWYPIFLRPWGRALSSVQASGWCEGGDWRAKGEGLPSPIGGVLNLSEFQSNKLKNSVLSRTGHVANAQWAPVDSTGDKPLL